MRSRLPVLLPRTSYLLQPLTATLPFTHFSTASLQFLLFHAQLNDVPESARHGKLETSPSFTVHNSHPSSIYRVRAMSVLLTYISISNLTCFFYVGGSTCWEL